MIGHTLGGRCGHREHCQLNLVALDDLLQAVQPIHVDAVDRGVRLARIGIEGGDDLKPFAGETAISQQSPSQIADPDQSHGPNAVGAEDAANRSAISSSQR